MDRVNDILDFSAYALGYAGGVIVRAWGEWHVLIVPVILLFSLLSMLFFWFDMHTTQSIADCVKAFGYTELQCKVIITNHLPVTAPPR